MSEGTMDPSEWNNLIGHLKKTSQENDTEGHPTPVALLAQLIKDLASHVMFLPIAEKGNKGDRGEPGPPGVGISDLTLPGQTRVKLAAVYEMLAAIQIVAKQEGFSNEARDAIKKARRLIKKAVGVMVTEEETISGKSLQIIQAQKRKEQKEKRKLRDTRREEEDDDDDFDEDDDDDDEEDPR